MIGYHDLVASDQKDFVAKLVALGADSGRREDASYMIRQCKQALYRDDEFIRVLDAFLKARIA